jgi:hypothetical protein
MGTATRLLAAVVTASFSLPAQAHPNFSGTWAIVPSRSIWYDDAQPVNITVFGERFWAEQTDQVLTLSIANENGFKWVYRLDGVVSSNAPPSAAGPQQTSSMIAWSGSALIITTIGSVERDGKLQPSETRRLLKFNEDGTLRVEAPWGRNGAMIASVYSRLP